MAQVVCRHSFKVVARANSHFIPGGICGRSGTAFLYSELHTRTTGQNMLP